MVSRCKDFVLCILILLIQECHKTATGCDNFLSVPATSFSYTLT